MRATIETSEHQFTIDLTQGIDISIPMYPSESSVRAWYVPPVSIEPVRMGDWVGAVKEGGSVNFRNILFNPHGHGTHTECVGHISKEDYSINQCLTQFFFLSELISIQPEETNGDRIISLAQVKEKLAHKNIPEAVIIRTLPNNEHKKQQQYSNTNPPYLDHEAALFLREAGVKHLLIDQPSVDKEVDEGKLLAHRAFWNYPENTRLDATITELIYVDNSITDGTYILNIQFASFENDASPSKPVLYAPIQ